jgi:hypothetical protein
MHHDLVWHSVEYLKEQLQSTNLEDPLTRAFVAWILPELQIDPSAAFVDASNHTGAARTYRDVAILGYGSALHALTAEMSAHLEEGLVWIAGRPSRIQGSLADFCSDGVAILGIAIAIRTQGDKNRSVSWLKSTCEASRNAPFIDPWEASLISAAPAVAQTSPLLPPIDPEVLLALHRRDAVKAQPTQSDRSLALTSLRDVSGVGLRLAAIRLASFMAVQAYSPTTDLRAPSIDDVVNLLRALPNGLLRWTWEEKAKTPRSEPRKWHIEHEYHFQNLLWLLLGSIFPDAKYEEYKDAVGSVHPRLDIVIPSLKLIVEVKYWRGSDSSSEMIRQIAEDASLYLTPEAPYVTIIAVIWDQAKRTEQHNLLIRGLERIKGVKAGVVIPQPSFMSPAR